MATLKIVLCIALFAVVALGNVVPETRREHNIDHCLKTSDNLKNKWTAYYHTSVDEDGKLLQIIKKEIKWPINGEAPGNIKCIRVTDLSADGKGGYPSLREGGVDFDHVTVHMESQRSRGLLFNIEILGEPEIPK